MVWNVNDDKKKVCTLLNCKPVKLWPDRERVYDIAAWIPTPSLFCSSIHCFLAFPTALTKTYTRMGAIFHIKSFKPNFPLFPIYFFLLKKKELSKNRRNYNQLQVQRRTRWYAEMWSGNGNKSGGHFEIFIQTRKIKWRK